MYLTTILVLLPAVSLARRAFPVGVEIQTQDIFRQINPRIQWDDTNYLVDEAGPYAVCRNQDRNGYLPVDSKLANSKKFGANGVGALIDSTRTTGRTVSGAKRDIYTIVKSWISKYPFVNQIKKASRFGCSVEPGCKNGRTLVVCLFSPKYSGSGGDDYQGDEGTSKCISDDLEIRGVAYTPEQYVITENQFRKLNPSINWDRSHLLENLSGTQTSCKMIGRSYWDSKSAVEEARSRGRKAEFIFGSTPRNGNTDRAVLEIARGWSKREWKVIKRARKVGCSLAVGCQGRRDILVASCLVQV